MLVPGTKAFSSQNDKTAQQYETPSSYKLSLKFHERVSSFWQPPWYSKKRQFSTFITFSPISAQQLYSFSSLHIRSVCFEVFRFPSLNVSTWCLPHLMAHCSTQIDASTLKKWRNSLLRIAFMGIILTTFCSLLKEHSIHSDNSIELH